MAQSAGVTLFSPGAQALGLGAVGANEDQQARNKRLASIAAARNNITGAVSAAGSNLFNMGSI
jgi:hypothetical protein